MSSPPNPGDRVGHELSAERRVLDVSDQSDRLLPGRLDQLSHMVGVGLLLRQVDHRDVGAFARVGDGDGCADTRVGAGDERLAPLQPAGAAVGLLTVVGR